MARADLIIVSGPAGSGKTTLAHELARRIGCPALCRDEIKEGMVASTPGFVPSMSDPLSLRTYEVFFAAIELFLRAEVTLVAEAAFQHRLWAQRLDPLMPLANLKIVRCHVSGEEATRRIRDRLAGQASRAAHADAEQLAADGSFVPLQLDVPTLDVETTDTYSPGLDAIAGFCRP